MLTFYLAGAIRDNRPEDIEWRARLGAQLNEYVTRRKIEIISPLGGKTFNPTTKEWLISGLPSEPRHIISQDFWAVDRADIIVVNLLPMDEGYQSIGTLMEYGRSTITSKLRYVIAPPKFRGSGNAMYPDIHPFLERTATAIFSDVDTCVGFLQRHLPYLLGQDWFCNGNYGEEAK